VSVARRKKPKDAKPGLARTETAPPARQPEPTPAAILSLADELGVLLADLWSAGKLDELADEEDDNAEDS
jgi:hypothetical protein